MRISNEFSHERILTKGKTRVFHEEVWDAKRQEAQSWCEHKPSNAEQTCDACDEQCGSKWQLTWTLTLNTVGKTECEVQARITTQGYRDAQAASVITRSPTVAKTTQRLFVCIVLSLVAWICLHHLNKV